ncbi:unnamed protein product [Cyprideis torosa]|uniref:Uncharacterized protein n=1 Tax=Cyprideis torosa TaxID=163714 RepID=A0A7R8WHJ1_9CRUS|nr:unnamed protein product [Cyprideis torosa]CAG0899475.1 unnamed protein product [Cyprideis torosa]
MKVLIVLACVATLASAAVIQGREQSARDQRARILKATQQQTVDGSYGFAFQADNGQARNEISNNGVVEGSYTYVDENGISRTVNYRAGPDGFQADSELIPKPPQPLPVHGQPAPHRPAPHRPAPHRPAPREIEDIPQFFPSSSQAEAPRFEQQNRQTFKQARPIPEPTPIERAQLQQQQRLLQETIANHEAYLNDVASGRIRSAPPQRAREDNINEDFRSVQVPFNFRPEPQFQQQSFRAPASTQPAQFTQPQLQHLPQGFASQQPSRPQSAFPSAHAEGTPFTFQFDQQPGQGFNFFVQN